MTDDSRTADVGTADKAKLTVAILIVVAGVAGYYVLGTQPGYIRWAVVVASLVLAAVTVGFSGYGHEFRRFMDQARVELRKVVWPTRDETLRTTAVVFGFVIVAGLFFWLLDLLLAWATKAFTGQGG
jgi:preprotein translocase subunit SecE